MKGKFLSIVGICVLLFGVVASVGAVMFAEPDGEGHPYVGLLVFTDGASYWRCTGTLVSETVVLTAGHCAAGATQAWVWFDADLNDGLVLSEGLTGTPHAHPEFGQSFPNTADVGVVVLDVAVTDRGFGTLAPVGFLNSLESQRGQQNVEFKIVGYGLQGVRPVLQADYIRYRGVVQLINLNSANTRGYNIQLTSNPGRGTGEGGLCFGDSGGAVFDLETNYIVAVNSFVLNQQCMGTGFSYRVDTDYSRDWLANFGI